VEQVLATARRDEKVNSHEIVRSISEALSAQGKSAIEWKKKSQRLGDAVEESLRIRGFRTVHREAGIIEVEHRTKGTLFIPEEAFERWLREIPPKTEWEIHLEIVPWADASWGLLPTLDDIEDTFMNNQDRDEIKRLIATAVADREVDLDANRKKENTLKRQLQENWLVITCFVGLFLFFNHTSDSLATKDDVRGQFATQAATAKGQFDLINQRLDFMGVPGAHLKAEPSSKK
jgi:hypothetical protein